MNWIDLLSVEVLYGELLEQDAQALMCPVSVDLEEYGKISQKVFRIGGSDFIRRIDTIREGLTNCRIALGETVSLEVESEYKLGGYEYILLTALWEKESEYTENLFYKAYITAIRAALGLGLQSIVVPAMGYDGHLPIAGSAFLRVINDLSELKNSNQFSLEEIFIMSSNERHIEYLKKNVETMVYR